MKRRLVQALFRGALLIGCTSVGSAEGEESLRGRYVLWQKTVTTSKIPILKDVTASSIAVTLVDLEHDGTRLAGAGRLCDLRLESSSRLVRTSFPAAFIQALPPVRVDATLEQRDGKDFLVSQAKTLVIGAQLQAPRSESLPRDATDPRIFDQDKDGKPGMTVRVDGFVSGEVYVVQRSSTQYSGPRTKDGFAGGVHFELEQFVVGASTALLRHGSTPQADSANSAFALIRVAPETGCSAAITLARKRYH